ncbi:MAG: MFS transporter, partial [Steroidobacteraceae bacterium]
LAAAQAALAVLHDDLRWLAALLAIFFGAFNFLEARLPAMLADAAGEAARGAALGLFSTCQFAGAFAGGLAGGILLGTKAAGPAIFIAGAIAAFAWLPFARR